MTDLRNLLDAFRRTREVGRTAVLATVVQTEGSTYRRAGARALVVSNDDGEARVVGLVSGGCLEGDLVARARAVNETGEPARVRYDSRDDDDLIFGLGLGCRGVVDVLLQRVGPDDPGPLDAFARFLDERESGVMATVVQSPTGEPALASHCAWGGDGNAIATGGKQGWTPQIAPSAARSRAGGTVREGQADVWIERIARQTRLVIVGAGPDAPALVETATALGWRVVLVDPRAALARRELFPQAERIVDAEPGEAIDLPLDDDTVAVVMSHQYARDRQALRWLLASRVRYIGALGPRARTDEMLADLAEDGFTATPEQLARLSAPAGLDIGGEGPQAIAISIAAEIQAVLAEHPGGRLRDRKAPIHENRGG